MSDQTSAVQLSAKPQRINCRRCVHFYVTWDKAMPYGCRKYGFKSQIIPSLEVFRSSGTSCLAYQAKPSGSGLTA